MGAGRMASVRAQAMGLKRYSATSFGAPDRFRAFFMERYGESYRREIETFVAGVAQGAPAAVSARDGLRAVYLAEAAGASLRLGKAIELKSGGEVTWDA